ncbi:MAG: TraB/GumN family protein [Pseudomonadota bacterium]
MPLLFAWFAACRRLGRLASVVVCSFALLASSVGAEAPTSNAGTGGGPAIWQVAGEAGQLFLFGTIHLLPADEGWQTPALRAAMRAAGSLTLEVAAADIATPEMTQFTMREGFFADGGTLGGTIDGALHERLKALASQLGLPMASLERMRPWLAAISLTMVYAQSQGFAQESGAEAWLSRGFTEMEKPILGLEDPLTGLKALAGPSPAAQEAMLAETIGQLADGGDILHQLHQAWRAGDTESLGALLLDGMQNQPELYQAIIVERNNDWVPKLEVLLATPGVHMVAVGAAHLIGEDSVIALLRQKGYEVRRLGDVVAR